MRFVAHTVIVFICLVITSSIHAGQVLTLDDCIELALKNRLSIIRARGSESVASANKRAALGAFLPRIDASYSSSETKSRNIKSDVEITHSFLRVDSIEAIDNAGDTVMVPIVRREVTGSQIHEVNLPDQDRNSKSLAFSAQMSLFNLPNWFNYFGARSDHAKARLDVLGSEQDLILSVKSSYYLHLAAAEKVAVDSQAVVRSEEQLKLIQSKYDLGSASVSDVLKQKVQFGNDKLAFLSTQNAVSTTRATLAYVVGIDPSSDVDFSSDYIVREYEGTLKDALEFGKKHKPSLLAMSESINASKQALRSSKAAYLPSLTGFASLSFSDATRGDTVTFGFSERSTRVGFSLNWNIFDGFNRERSLTNAKVNLNNARAALADERNRVASKIKTAYLDIQRLKEQQEVAGENIEAAMEDLRITQEKYNLGAATILDLLDAQVSLKRAQVAGIRADFDLNIKVAELENAMGKM